MHNKLTIDEITQGFITQCAMLIAKPAVETADGELSVDAKAHCLAMANAVKGVCDAMNEMGVNIETESGSELNFDDLLIALLEDRVSINSSEGGWKHTHCLEQCNEN